MQSASNRRFTDTPMWNSRLSKKMWAAYLADEATPDIAYASPMEARNFSDLPPAYIEVAEFDCLHDEGLEYARALGESGVKVAVNRIQGAVHGFDIVKNASITQAAVAERISFLQRMT